MLTFAKLSKLINLCSGLCKQLIITVVAMLTALAVAANVVSGFVVDSLTRAPVPYAAVMLAGTDRGELADDAGRFSIATSLSYSGVTANAMGYAPKTVSRQHSSNDYLIELVPTGVRLGEVSVRPRKEKYTKKNNPAVALMQRIRSLRDENDPRRNSNYNYEKYERITLALDEVGDGNVFVKKFPLLSEHMDTSVIDGRPILNVALREKVSHINYRKSPRGEKEIVSGFRSEGIDQMLDKQATQTLYEDVLREIDIYKSDDITLMQNRFVSPLSRIAPDFYKFYLSDTVAVGVDTCIVLSFAPHNSQTFGFAGKLYVDKNDPSLLIRRIEMSAPKKINLNFINNLKIVQEYQRAADGSRLKTFDDMVVEAGLLSGGSQIYARRITSYTRHNFNPAPDGKIFNRMADVITLPQASARNEAFWNNARTVDISAGENSVGVMLDRLRDYPLFYWSEKVLRILVTGYINTGNPSKWDFGPMNTTISFNDLEGVRLRAGGMTTANLSRRFFTKDYVAYGFRDRKWKYMTELEWSFCDKEYHAREFPVHSVRLTHLYDVDMLGQHYLFTNADNIFLSLKHGEDHLMTYHRVTKFEYTLELENNFSLLACVKHERQEASRWVDFVTGDGYRAGHYSMATVGLTLRYAPGEKFFQTKSSRRPVNLDAPVVQLSHRWGPRNTFGNRFALSVTELSFQKRFWLSAFGYVDAIVKGGHVWTRSPFPNLLIPNANMSYTIQPESFALMRPMEFVNDTYASWDLTYWANGALFNYVPLIKKLKLREVIAFRGVWGHLSDKNNPALDKSLFQFPTCSNVVAMRSMPYMEISAGVDNLFRILRVDYVWRLSYRDTPGCDRGGVRIALHFSF